MPEHSIFHSKFIRWASLSGAITNAAAVFTAPFMGMGGSSLFALVCLCFCACITLECWAERFMGRA